jgi:hypothetical protein
MLLKHANLKFWPNVATTAFTDGGLGAVRRSTTTGVEGVGGDRTAVRRAAEFRRTVWSCAEPANVAAAGKPSHLCKSLTEAGTTSPGARSLDSLMATEFVRILDGLFQ